MIGYLPDDSVFAFVPSHEFVNQVRQIRTVFQDMPGYIRAAIVVLTLENPEILRDKLPRRLGLDREAEVFLTIPRSGPDRRSVGGKDSALRNVLRSAPSRPV